MAFGSGDDAVAFGGECGAAWVGQVVGEGVIMRELEDLDFVGSVVRSGGPDSKDNGSGVFLNDQEYLVFVGGEVVAATFVRPEQDADGQHESEFVRGASVRSLRFRTRRARRGWLAPEGTVVVVVDFGE